MSFKNTTYRLSEIESNQGIRFSHAGAAPGHHCPMHTALATIRNIEGLSSLVVGMPECSFYSRYVMENPVGLHGELHYTYVLDSNEVVFGCSEGLVKALEEMEADGARAIVVIMTCVPALIGEDVAEITESFSEVHNTKAVCIDLAHFKRNGYEAGFYQVYEALAEFCKKTDKTNQVSIFGPIKGQEGDTFRLWLRENNYETLEMNARFSIDDFIEITKSRLNLVTHIHYLPLARRLKEVYQIPFVFIGGTYSSHAIHVCYQEVRAKLGLSDLPDFSHFTAVKDLEDKIRKQFKDSRFIVMSVIEDVLPLTEYLSSLSMRPCFIHLEEYQPWMKEWKQKILSYSVNPFISYVVQKDINMEVLGEAGFVDLKGFRFSFGEVSLEGVACIKGNRSFLPPLIGYERTLFLLNRLEDIWKEEEHAVV